MKNAHELSLSVFLL